MDNFEGIPGAFNPSNTPRPIIVVGTRPEAIKMFPVILGLKEDPHYDPIVIASGQHPEMCLQVLRMAGIEPDIALTLERSTGSLNELVAQLMTKLTATFEQLAAEYNPPGYLPIIPATLVHGDTTTAMTAALVSTFTGISVIHVEAGLRTYDLYGPFPEELNRQLIARTAVLSIAPTMPSEANLIHEAILSQQIFVAGNTGIDALFWAVDRPATFTDERLSAIMKSDDPLLVVTAHRRENWANLDDISDALLRICHERPDLSVVLPLHPNPSVRSVFQSRLTDQPQILLTEPLEYIEFAHLLKRATIALTDSGGIQEEAPSLGTPVLVMREQTERPEGIAAGTLQLVGTNPDSIVEHTLRLLNNPQDYMRMVNSFNPYGDGRASKRIIDALDYLYSGQSPPTTFGPGFSRAFVLSRTGIDYAHLRPQPPRSAEGPA